MNKKALLDAELYARTGRVRSPCPVTLSDDKVEVVEIRSDSADGVRKSQERGSTDYCRCDEARRGGPEAQAGNPTGKFLWEPHQVVCVEDEPEQKQLCSKEPVEREPSSSPSKETLHETNSEFVPSAAELETDTNSSLSTSEKTSSTRSDNSDVEASEEDASEEDAPEDIEQLANQVSFFFFWYCALVP